MALREEKAADLAQIIFEVGVPVVWKGKTLSALVSVPVIGQEFEIGGLVETVDFTVKILVDSFAGADLPKHGDRVIFENREYRILKISSHPQYPALTFGISPLHE